MNRRHRFGVELRMAARAVERLMDEIAAFVDPERHHDSANDMAGPRALRIMLLAHDQRIEGAEIGIGMALTAADR